MLLLMAVACVKFSDTTEIDISAAVPGMSRACDPDSDDITDKNGDRVYSLIEPQGEYCRGLVYSRAKAVDWADIKAEVGDKKTTWLEFVSAMQGAAVTTTPVMPLEGISIRLLQLVATKSGDLDKHDGDPEALFPSLLSFPKIVGSDQYAVGLEHTFTGGEPENLAELLPNGVDTYAFNDIPGPIATIQKSFDNDESVHIITVGEVLVPMASIEAVLPDGSEALVDITIDLVEGMDYRIKVNLL